jgi:hypothetical protein
MKKKFVLMWYVIGLILISLALIYLVYLLTHKYGLFGLSANDGAIGDAINGITAPVIGIAGSLLIFISFREQVKANNLLSRFNEYKLYVDFINELKRDILDLHNKKGFIATTPYLTNIRNRQSVPAKFKRQLIFILKEFIDINQRVIEIQILSDSEKATLKFHLNNLYESYLEVYCNAYDEWVIIRPERVPLGSKLKNLSKTLIDLNAAQTKENLVDDEE